LDARLARTRLGALDAVKRAKATDAGAYGEALEALRRNPPDIASVIAIARRSAAAMRGALRACEDAALPVVALGGEPDGSLKGALRRAAGRGEDARRARNPIAANEAFRCRACDHEVPAAPGAASRNHCPRCLRSLHVDGAVPGDRASACAGLMDPVRAELRGGRWKVVQRCRRCGHERANTLHPEWAVDPDDLAALPAEGR
jgi:hypothetical protein